jgi:hypothetical protein
MVKRLEVEELWGVIGVKLPEVKEYLVFDIFDQICIVPEFIEPHFEITPIPITVHFQVEFNIVVCAAESQPADGEV